MPIIGQLLPGDVREFGHDRSIRVIRARYLILYYVLAIVLTAVALLVIAFPEVREAGNSPIIKSTSQATFSIGLFALLLIPARRANIGLATLVPIVPAWAARWSVGTAIALFIVASGTVHVLYLPLSYISPGYVEARLFSSSTTFYWHEGDHYILANAISFFTVVLLGPVVEELFFRGLLLRIWISKWGVRRAIVYSSLLFALLHVDHLGTFLIAVVLSLSYIWSRRIEVPILIHITYNLSFSLLEGVYLSVSGPHENTLADFQAYWWSSALALMVGVPVLIWFLRKGAQVAVVTPSPTFPPQGGRG